MTIAVAATSTIAAIDVEAITHKGELIDRKIIAVRDCGHRYYVGLPLDAPLPEIGSPALRCLTCTLVEFRR